MDIVSSNRIRQGIAGALAEVFPGITVYDEEIEQGLKTPYFMVQLQTTSQVQELDRRYHRTHTFDIGFFPEGPQYNEEAHATAEILYDALATVDIEGEIYRGLNMKHEVNNQTLHFFVDYRFWVWKSKPETPKMQTLEQEGILNYG
ncbi:phage tail terminator family protein [Paenibacillus lentus]|uniref:DUF3168 domain-containing protein n=1 Tax=Paenibacillus lentus TaxID=1338368 RepID=A0A3Q8SE04_9BACL|nr:hypothetical protein [Paenibacillus lentus]AZK48515.1 hypothetical protein EIM92_21980 [Paenibacillus lentus]